MERKLTSIHNAQPISRSDIVKLPIAEFRTLISNKVASGNRLVAMICQPGKESNSLTCVLADEKGGRLHLVMSDVGKEYPSLTPDCVQAQLFEREIFERFGVFPTGHPWLKPVRFPKESFHQHHDIGNMKFFKVDGSEVHEVAVGPVHAGVIEPGHFRFQCHGEKVFHLEISLGYQHRGIERAFIGASPSKRCHFAETLAGDTTAGHMLAHCNVLESLAGALVPIRAQSIRSIALELERIACHIGDLGALAGDVGFLPTSAFCGRIRGVVLNMTAMICGNRFSRGLIRPGGVAYDIDANIAQNLLEELKKVRTDVKDAVDLLWETPSVVGRFEGTGVVTKKDALAIGLVGPAARASGISRDVRQNFAHGIYQFQQIPVAIAETCDVFARAMIRWLEILRSLTFVEEMLKSLPGSDLSCELSPMKSNMLTVALVEGWRGEICHIGTTGDNGEISDYKIIDPSFHNWFGLSMALRNGAISDFPLCNKSFNLSYCGFDL